MIDSKIFKALLFDFDGTLVHTEPVHYEAFVQTLATYGKEFVSYDEHLKNNTGTGTRNILRKELERHNLRIDLEQAAMQKKNIYADLIRQKGAAIIPGAVALLTSAKQKDMKLGLVSGGMRDNIDLVIDQSGMPKVFDVEITTESVTKPKPDPEGFLKAMQSLGLKTAECIVFEDGINGVAAALASGITTQFVIGNSVDKERIKEILPGVTFIADFTTIEIQ